MSKDAFMRHLGTFSHLTANDFWKVSWEEGAGQIISHPDIQTIQHLVSTV